MRVFGMGTGIGDLSLQYRPCLQRIGATAAYKLYIALLEAITRQPMKTI